MSFLFPHPFSSFLPSFYTSLPVFLTLITCFLPPFLTFLPSKRSFLTAFSPSLLSPSLPPFLHPYLRFPTSITCFPPAFLTFLPFLPRFLPFYLVLPSSLLFFFLHDPCTPHEARTVDEAAWTCVHANKTQMDLLIQFTQFTFMAVFFSFLASRPEFLRAFGHLTRFSLMSSTWLSFLRRMCIRVVCNAVFSFIYTLFGLCNVPFFVCF